MLHVCVGMNLVLVEVGIALDQFLTLEFYFVTSGKYRQFRERYFYSEITLAKTGCLQCCSQSYDIVYPVCVALPIQYMSASGTQNSYSEKVLRWVMRAVQCLVLAVMMW